MVASDRLKASAERRRGPLLRITHTVRAPSLSLCSSAPAKQPQAAAGKGTLGGRSPSPRAGTRHPSFFRPQPPWTGDRCTLLPTGACASVPAPCTSRRPTAAGHYCLLLAGAGAGDGCRWGGPWVGGGRGTAEPAGNRSGRKGSAGPLTRQTVRRRPGRGRAGSPSGSRRPRRPVRHPGRTPRTGRSAAA